MAYMTLSKFLTFPGFGFAICKMEIISPLQDKGHNVRPVLGPAPATAQQVQGTGSLLLLLSCHCGWTGRVLCTFCLPHPPLAHLTEQGIIGIVVFHHDLLH